MTYILADDDPLYRDLTCTQLNDIGGLTCLAVCENALIAREQIIKLEPDFIVLDIEMPGLTGLQLAKSLKQLPFVIFITSHTNFAVEAFELDAIDYLVKPVTTERLMRSIDKIKILHDIKSNTTVTEAFQVKDTDSFFVKEKNTFTRIYYKEVIYAESLGDFVNIYLENGDKKIVLVSMKNLEQQLAKAPFIRISRTYMVNKQKVSSIETDMIYLNQKIQLPIGQTYAEAVVKNIIGNSAIKRFI